MLYHIDTDMGVDDALALVMAERAMGGTLIGISTVAGNVPVEAASRNALILRALLGRVGDLPIYQGAGCASDGFAANAEHVHGSDGLGNTTASWAHVGSLADGSVRPLAEISRRPAGTEKLTLIGLGPATNLPELIKLYGRDAIAGIVIMSGVFFDCGNITPHAEFNAYFDPSALTSLMASGLPITFVPLDVCRKIELPRALARSWLAGTTSGLAELIVAAHMAYMDFYAEWEGIDGCFPHDTVAVLAALHPGRLFALRGDVTVEAAGDERGRTRIRPDPDAVTTIVTGGPLKWIREALDNPQFADAEARVPALNKRPMRAP
jgi:inosine-uridine nucleoside N-ribohydrolase